MSNEEKRLNIKPAILMENEGIWESLIEKHFYNFSSILIMGEQEDL